MGEGVTVNAFDPGLMPGSGLARDYPPLQRLAWRYLLPALRVLPGVRSTRTSGPGSGPAGERRPVRRRQRSVLRRVATDQVVGQSYDRDKALDLWETSERLLTHAAK